MRELAGSTRVMLAVIVGSIVLSAVIAVDITSAGHEYEMPRPTLVHGFPNALYYYNISEAVTENDFSLIITVPSNLSGQHHVIPRAISLRMWFMDVESEENLSELIVKMDENFSNCSLALRSMNHDPGSSEGFWWNPSLLYVEFNDVPDASGVRYGVNYGLYLSNIGGSKFNGDSFLVRVDMNITYSRWWFGLPVAQSHQTVTYTFDITAEGPIHLYSLEYPYPHLPGHM